MSVTLEPDGFIRFKQEFPASGELLLHYSVAARFADAVKAAAREAEAKAAVTHAQS